MPRTSYAEMLREWELLAKSLDAGSTGGLEPLAHDLKMQLAEIRRIKSNTD